MKTRYAVALSLLTGLALGGIAIHGLHAQSKPPVYYVAEVEVIDRDGYLKEFVPRARAMRESTTGGRILAQGGTTTTLVGDPPKARVVIQQWDSLDQLQKWFNSTEQSGLRAIQAKYAKVRAFTVAGIPSK